MPAVDDIVSFHVLTEQGGVQMSNKTYWQIDDLGDDPALKDAVFDFLVAYHATVDDICSTTWKVVCGIYENLTADEGKIVVFNSLAGVSLNTGHAQFQVFRVNRYGLNLALDAVKRGAFNQSGVEEAQSVRDRMPDPGVFADLVQFLSITSILGGTGWTIQPHLRWNTTTPPAAPVYEFIPNRLCQMSPGVKTIRSRKTSLCGTS